MNIFQPSTGVSTQEEAHTLIMIHSAEISEAGISWPKTQMLWSLLFKDSQFSVFRQPYLWEQVTTEEKMLMKPIYVRLGTSKAAELPGFHFLTGCDTCGHIKGIGKKTAFKAFTEATPAELTALSQVDVKEKLSAYVISGCGRFLCRFFGTKKNYRPTQLKNWGGSAFRANMGDR